MGRLPIWWTGSPYFFMMSGAIFTHNYLQKIASYKISIADFGLRRLARLYPLHLLTLSTVALLQSMYRSQHGRSFIYENNDITHFILNLLFASHWGFERGHSFNAPVWSVSHEVLLYAAFFLFASKTGRLGKPIIAALLTVLPLAIFVRLGISPIAKSAFAFFSGIFIYQLAVAISRVASARRRLIFFACALLGIFALRPLWSMGGCHTAPSGR